MIEPNSKDYESFTKLLNKVSQYHFIQKEKFFNEKKMQELEKKRANRNDASQSNWVG